jgi:putative spermidine/putrescine transport system ATP-binding protein
MDEPLGALDKQLREQMQYEIKHIHENLGVTIVYVTHDQSEALTMSDRIAVFNDGVIQQLSTPEQLYEKPENSFVAQFIGENNQLSGTINSRDGDLCSVTLDYGETIAAEQIVAGGEGTRTTLSIRPERVELDPQVGSLPVIIDGRIEELIYLGDHIRVRMSVAGTDEFVVKVRSNTLGPALQTGQQTTVGWRPEDCRALNELAA